jgi:hypothetical protein
VIRSFAAPALRLLLRFARAEGRGRAAAGLACEGRVADLDADSLAVHVVLVVQDALVDVLGAAHEGLLHAGARLRTRLEEDQVVPLGEGLALLRLHLALVLQVRLVAHEDDLHFLVTVLLHLLEPLDTVLKAGATRDVVDEQRANGAAVVRAGN